MTAAARDDAVTPEAIEAAADAMDVGMWVAFDRRDHLEAAMRVAIEAALPALREAIAQEIEADVGISEHPWLNGMKRAALIVRKATS